MRKERKNLQLSALELNAGQLGWMPRNPREWTKDDVARTARSIEEDPDFLEERPLLVVPSDVDGKFVVFGGNLRSEGARKNRMKAVPCVVHYPESEEDRQTVIRRALKDNGSMGRFDYDILANEYSEYDLTDFGIPAWPQEEGGETGGGGEAKEDNEIKDNVENENEKYSLKLSFKTLEEKNEWIEYAKECGVRVEVGLNWGHGIEHKCDLIIREKTYKQRHFFYTASFHNTENGEALSKIKVPTNVKIFADAAINVIIKKFAGIERGKIRLVSAPARKHKENNFTEMVCDAVAREIGVKYEKDLIKLIKKDRFHPVFCLTDTVSEEYIVLYDDIVTTGKTIMELYRLFDGEKKVIVVVGIENDRPIKV